MSEWWTYRPSDFLMFSARSYRRLFELYNIEWWPAQPVLMVLGLALAVALWQGRRGAPRAGFALLGAAWLWIAWAFHWQRFATINTAAGAYAVAFAVEGGLLIAAAALGPSLPPRGAASRARSIGLVLLLMAVLGVPALAPLLGRPALQAEVWGLAPDPTVLATLGLLLAAPPDRRGLAALLWPIPLLWCAASGLTLATMGSAESLLLPVAALLALAVASRQGPNAP